MPTTDTPKSKYAGQKFLVKDKHFGAFPGGTVFTEAQFRRHYPAPKDEPDVEDYHETNLARAINLGAVVFAPPDAPVDVVPPGPEFKQAKYPEPTNPAEKPAEKPADAPPPAAGQGPAAGTKPAGQK